MSKRKMKDSRDVKRRPRNSRNFKKPQTKEEVDRALDESPNDPEWYGNYPTLLRDNFSVPFNSIPGSQVDLKPYKDVTDVTTSWSPAYIPSTVDFVSAGLCALHVRFNYDTESSKDALKNAANNLYIKLNAHNSRNRAYDPNDIMLYCLAMANCYSALECAERTYGLATMYATQNSYMPEAHLKALNVDVYSLTTQLDQFRSNINRLIIKLNTLPVPTDIALFKRHIFMFSQIYSEGEGVKDQQYMFIPDAFFRFGYDDEGKGQLHEVNSVYNQDEQATLQNIVDEIEIMVDALYYDQDAQTIGADILKAYGGSNMYSITPLDVHDFIVPESNKYVVLETIKNATVPTPGCNYAGAYLTQEITDNENRLRFTRTMHESATLVPGSNTKYADVFLSAAARPILLTTVAPDPTPDLIAELTRLCAIPAFRTHGWEVVAGTEFVTRVDYLIRERSTSPWKLGPVVSVTPNNTAGGYQLEVGNSTTNVGLGKMLAARSAFQYAPKLTIATTTATSGGTEPLTFNGYTDLIQADNYVRIDRDTLSNMHVAALMSLLAVPNVMSK